MVKGVHWRKQKVRTRTRTNRKSGRRDLLKIMKQGRGHFCDCKEPKMFWRWSVAESEMYQSKTEHLF